MSKERILFLAFLDGVGLSGEISLYELQKWTKSNARVNPRKPTWGLKTRSRGDKDQWSTGTNSSLTLVFWDSQSGERRWQRSEEWWPVWVSIFGSCWEFHEAFLIAKRKHTHRVPEKYYTTRLMFCCFESVVLSFLSSFYLLFLFFFLFELCNANSAVCKNNEVLSRRSTANPACGHFILVLWVGMGLGRNQLNERRDLMSIRKTREQEKKFLQELNLLLRKPHSPKKWSR